MTPNQLAYIATLLYGERWQSALANALQVSPRNIRYWAAGRPIPPGIPHDIAILILDRIKELNAIQSRLMASDNSAGKDTRQTSQAIHGPQERTQTEVNMDYKARWQENWDKLYHGAIDNGASERIARMVADDGANALNLSSILDLADLLKLERKEK